MDNAEKSIEQVNADTIYTSKQFKRIKDNFQVSSHSVPPSSFLWVSRTILIGTLSLKTVKAQADAGVE